MISKDEMLKLADLARLKLQDSEIAGLQKDISSILDYVAQVNTFAAAEQGAALPAPEPRNVMRDDAGAPALGAREALLGAFPTREGDFNVVRKIIQKDE